MINIAVIGSGDWGKNLVRNFSQLENAHLKTVCDTDEKRLQNVRSAYPGVSTTTKLAEVLDDKDISAVVIASPAVMHYQMVEAALLKGKHTYVEKPFTLKSAEAQKLVNLARDKKLVLMVGHLLKYHPAVTYLKNLIDSGDIGEVYYLYSQRLNLGKVRADENAMWSFAPHDLAVINYLLGETPVSVSARGEAYLQKNIDDVVFMTLGFKSKKIAHIHISWLDPHKVRRLTIVGSKKMVVFDDTEATDKIKIYDKGASKETKYETYGEYISLRFGDIIIPHLKLTEPLNVLCKHFIDCVTNNKVPLTDGQDGLEVVKILESAQQSLDKDGMPIGI
ncbi:MAG: Gfo/Idh/MocA family oxidoreductase [Candidatus Brocadiia bacterium]